MARNSITIGAPPEVVYGVLADPPTYALWVVGNKNVRGCDREWPAPGTRFHHTLGVGPLVTKDDTIALESDPPRRLVMEVRGRPLLRATVTFELVPDGAGTVVTMEEHPRGDPWRKLWNPAFDALTGLRNAETLRRLKRLSEVRAGVVHP